MRKWNPGTFGWTGPSDLERWMPVQLEVGARICFTSHQRMYENTIYLAFRI